MATLFGLPPRVTPSAAPGASLFGLPARPSAVAKPSLFGLPSRPGSGNAGGSIAGKHSPAVATMQNLIMGIGETISDHRGFNAMLKSNYGANINPSVMLVVGKPEMVKGQQTWAADGVWGRHTDAGLQEALKLAEVLERAHEGLHLAGESFVSATLKDLIPENFSKASSEIADKISGELDALKQDYIRDIQNTVLQHSDDKEAFYARTHGDDIVLTLPGGVPLRLSDLASAQTLMPVLQRAYPGSSVDVKTHAKELLAQLGVSSTERVI